MSASLDPTRDLPGDRAERDEPVHTPGSAFHVASLAPASAFHVASLTPAPASAFHVASLAPAPASAPRVAPLATQSGDFATRLRAPPGVPLITFTICRYPPGQRFWALRQMGLARRPLAATPGLDFHRLLGSGASPGFSLRPDLGRYALLAAWSSEQAADDFFAAAPLLRAWREHSSELWTVKLLPRRSRGSWAGLRPFTPPTLELPPLPVVVITRASLRLRALISFWRRVPAINRDLLASPGLRLALGVGELPWLRPVTVSLWDDDAALERFAFHGSRHHEATRAAIDHRWFREDLFARFAAIASQGRVDGRDPCGFQAVLPDMSRGPAAITAS